jgi:hypothetical protein
MAPGATHRIPTANSPDVTRNISFCVACDVQCAIVTPAEHPKSQGLPANRSRMIFQLTAFNQGCVRG